jgi:cell wall-associated NlpC family hydrolase
LQRGDGIFTFDTQSTLSHIITHFDQGTWSHSATYVGDGKVVEAIGEGVLERPIESYRNLRSTGCLPDTGCSVGQN